MPVIERCRRARRAAVRRARARPAAAGAVAEAAGSMAQALSGAGFARERRAGVPASLEDVFIARLRKPPLKDGSHAMSFQSCAVAILTFSVLSAARQRADAGRTAGPGAPDAGRGAGPRHRDQPPAGELRARESAAAAVLDQRQAADLPTLAARRPAISAPTTSTSSGSCSPDRRSRLSIRTCRTTGARGSTCSGRSTPAAATTRSSRRPTPSGKPAARTSTAREPICGSRRRARSGRW